MSFDELRWSKTRDNEPRRRCPDFPSIILLCDLPMRVPDTRQDAILSVAAQLHRIEFRGVISPTYLDPSFQH
eukprot:752752-Hanusia_phi.AAC.5